MGERRNLYPPVEPNVCGMLAVGDGQPIYREICGNPNGTPALAVHGGPGRVPSRRTRRRVGSYPTQRPTSATPNWPTGMCRHATTSTRKIGSKPPICSRRLSRSSRATARPPRWSRPRNDSVIWPPGPIRQRPPPGTTTGTQHSPPWKTSVRSIGPIGTLVHGWSRRSQPSDSGAELPGSTLKVFNGRERTGPGTIYYSPGAWNTVEIID